MAFDIDEELDKRATHPCPGWTNWVHASVLPTGTDSKPFRPWCRGRDWSKRQAPWIPRSGKRPSRGVEWTVYSPGGKLDRLPNEGWFFANGYLMRDADFDPGGDHCGVWDDKLVDEIQRKFQGYYYRQRFGR